MFGNMCAFFSHQINDDARISVIMLPNIIFALADDTGWHGVGWHQSQSCQADPNCAMLTPHMDALLSDGVELTQHYTYRFCSPTRSALMTGRLPIHVNQQNSAEYPWTAAAMHPDFRTVADVLRDQAHYATHQLGKWHLGLARQAFTPAGRGFDTSVGYLSGSEEHFTHAKGMEACKATLPLNCTYKCATDFWNTAAPATGYDGVYSANVYASEAVKIIDAAATTTTPFFIYLAFANTHEPLEAPAEYQARYPTSMQPKSRMFLGAMISAMDDAMRNITDALKASQQWDNTLIVWVSDNGGPTGVGDVGAKASSCAANNFPLRGGKGSAFQGGVRTAGFVGGGYVPPAVRGTSFDGYIHIADWFATFCNVAGIPGAAAADDATAPRPSDSIDAWPAITRRQTTFRTRTEVPISLVMEGGPRTVPHPGWRIASGALIVGNLKIIIGAQNGQGVHFYPDYPNTTTRPQASDPGCPNCGTTAQCGAKPSGCLYDISVDPEERHDLAKTNPTALANLTARIYALIPSLYQSDIVKGNNGTYDCQGALRAARGPYAKATGTAAWFGPWLK